ncbi:RecB family exonuclease [Nonomuraea recticatena]|uniref:PD-(D/E)XK endonuclease-like domain-containing protein n=1 Tax=Nonomuraea recticatena TaxID=46178 RepID=A0ABP6FA90_9ACTN
MLLEPQIKHRSVSQLNSYSACGLCYLLKRVLRLPQSPAAWSIQGTAVHAAIETFERSRRTADDETVLNRYREVWTEKVEAALEAEGDLDAWMKSGNKRPEKDLEDRFARGLDQVRSYLLWVQTDPLTVWTLPDSGEPAVEVKFREPFGGVEVLGFIDLIMQDPRTGDLLVRDIKTGSKKPVGGFQLATYRWAVNDRYGVDCQWGDFWMGKDGKPSAPEYLGRFTRQQVNTWYQMMDEAESAEIYIPNPGDHCRTCDVARHCPQVGGTPPPGVPMLGTY